MTIPNTVWIIEDHRSLRKTLHEAIELSGTDRVMAFASCEAALSVLSETSEHPGVVLLDIGLPGISGLEGLRRFKEIAPTSEIIMFTVFDDRPRVFEAICQGASGYLLKSESLERIVAAVAEVRCGGAPMTPEIARAVLEQFSQRQTRRLESDLSEREREVLSLLADGLTKKEIGGRLKLSLHTVDNYVRRIYSKLHVNSIGGAVAKALRDGVM